MGNIDLILKGAAIKTDRFVASGGMAFLLPRSRPGPIRSSTYTSTPTSLQAAVSASATIHINTHLGQFARSSPSWLRRGLGSSPGLSAGGCALTAATSPAMTRATFTDQRSSRGCRLPARWTADLVRSATITPTVAVGHADVSVSSVAPAGATVRTSRPVLIYLNPCLSADVHGAARCIRTSSVPAAQRDGGGDWARADKVQARALNPDNAAACRYASGFGYSSVMWLLFSGTSTCRKPWVKNRVPGVARRRRTATWPRCCC